jgi:hypothetical protein
MADGVVVGLDRAVEEKDRAAVTLAPAGDEGRYRIAEVVPAASGRYAAEVFGQVVARWWSWPSREAHGRGRDPDKADASIAAIMALAGSGRLPGREIRTPDGPQQAVADPEDWIFFPTPSRPRVSGLGPRDPHGA